MVNRRLRFVLFQIKIKIHKTLNTRNVSEKKKNLLSTEKKGGKEKSLF